MNKIWYDYLLGEELTRSLQHSDTVKRKKRFLKWMKQNFYIEEEELEWFLQDLIDDEQLLTKLHFVRDIKHCPKGMIISTSGVSGLSFLFFKGEVYTEDIYTAYHELQLYRDEAFFIKVDLPHYLQNSLYSSLLEDEINDKINDRVIADQLLTHLLEEGQIERIESAINRALDERNYKQFIQLSNKLKQLKKNSQNP